MHWVITEEGTHGDYKAYLLFAFSPTKQQNVYMNRRAITGFKSR